MCTMCHQTQWPLLTLLQLLLLLFSPIFHHVCTFLTEYRVLKFCMQTYIDPNRDNLLKNVGHAVFNQNVATYHAPFPHTLETPYHHNGESIFFLLNSITLFFVCSGAKYSKMCVISGKPDIRIVSLAPKGT